jgi:hypothetical protein
MSKTNFTVVRNAAYIAAPIGVRERHNERKNETYYKSDVVPEREAFNVHFLKCDGETYEQKFNRLIDEGVVVKRGLKPDAKVFDELVFDVNTDYFEQHGGYEYAKKFYAEAYRCAVNEIGGEQFVLSAVLHADERNSALSEQLGRDVYHYHLHVVYVPVVEKEVKWTKRCSDPALVGTVKEVISQISHSKKWPIRVPVERDGKTKVLNSYSLLQDRYFEHMRAAGFDGFERGERGSTREHWDVLDYKIQQEKIRLGALGEQVEQAEAELTKTEQMLEKKTAQVEKLSKDVTVKTSAKATVKEIDAMGHSLPLVPGVHFSDEEAAKLKALAKKSVTIDDRIAAMKKKMAAVEQELADVKTKLRDAQNEAKHWYQELTYLKEEVKDYLRLAKKFPARVKEFFTGLFREETAQEQAREQQHQQQKSHKREETR